MGNYLLEMLKALFTFTNNIFTPILTIVGIAGIIWTVILAVIPEGRETVKTTFETIRQFIMRFKTPRRALLLGLVTLILIVAALVSASFSIYQNDQNIMANKDTKLQKLNIQVDELSSQLQTSQQQNSWLQTQNEILNNNLTTLNNTITALNNALTISNKQGYAQPSDLISSHLSDLKIRLTYLATDYGLIEGKVFDNCTFFGPAIIQFQDPISQSTTIIFQLDRGEPIDSLFIATTNDVLTGIIAFKNCIFNNCTFVHIGYIAKPDVIEIMKSKVKIE